VKSDYGTPYDPGWKATCLQCGNCCTLIPMGAGYPIYKSDYERIKEYCLENSLPLYLEKSSWSYCLRNPEGKDACPYLSKDTKCLVHPVKPSICESATPGTVIARKQANCPADHPLGFNSDPLDEDTFYHDLERETTIYFAGAVYTIDSIEQIPGGQGVPDVLQTGKDYPRYYVATPYT